MVGSSTAESTIVVCEDAPAVLALADRTLREAGYHVRMALDAPRCLRAVLTIPAPAMLLLDVFLPNVRGIDVYRIMRKSGSTMPVLLMTGYPAELVDLDRIELGLSLIEKPFDAEQLERQVVGFLKGSAKPEPPGEPIVEIGEIKINLRSGVVHRGNRTFRVVGKELDVLFHLLIVNGKSVKNDTLIDAYFGGRVSPTSREYTGVFRNIKAKLHHPDESKLIEKTGDGWTMISPLEDIKRKMLWGWVRPDTHARRAISDLHLDDPPDPPERW